MEAVGHVACHPASPCCLRFTRPKHIENCSAVPEDFSPTAFLCFVVVRGSQRVVAGGGFLLLSHHLFSCSAMLCAVCRALAETRWEVDRPLCWVRFSSPTVPEHDTAGAVHLLPWLCRYTTWSTAGEASWHLSHMGPCSMWSATWPIDMLRFYRLPSSPSRQAPVDSTGQLEGEGEGRAAVARTFCALLRVVMSSQNARALRPPALRSFTPFLRTAGEGIPPPPCPTKALSNEYFRSDCMFLGLN